MTLVDRGAPRGDDDDRDPLLQQHWLVWETDAVTGCHCGFKSDLNQSDGWGIDVVDHLLKVAREDERQRRS